MYKGQWLLRGGIVYFRGVEGTVKPGMKIRMMASGAEYEIIECGHLRPLGLDPCKELIAGRWGTLPPPSRM